MISNQRKLDFLRESATKLQIFKDHHLVQKDKDAKEHRWVQMDKDTKDHRRVHEDKAKYHHWVQMDKDAGDVKVSKKL